MHLVLKRNQVCKSKLSIPLPGRDLLRKLSRNAAYCQDEVKLFIGSCIGMKCFAAGGDVLPSNFLSVAANSELKHNRIKQIYLSTNTFIVSILRIA